MPFKQWLAKVGRERIDEINDPEIGIDRLMETYLRKGYSVAWIALSNTPEFLILWAVVLEQLNISAIPPKL